MLSPLGVLPSHQDPASGPRCSPAASSGAGVRGRRRCSWRAPGLLRCARLDRRTRPRLRGPVRADPGAGVPGRGLRGREEWMTGRLIYCEAFWALDCTGLRDPRLAGIEERLGTPDRRTGVRRWRSVGPCPRTSPHPAGPAGPSARCPRLGAHRAQLAARHLPAGLPRLPGAASSPRRPRALRGPARRGVPGCRAARPQRGPRRPARRGPARRRRGGRPDLAGRGRPAPGTTTGGRPRRGGDPRGGGSWRGCRPGSAPTVGEHRDEEDQERDRDEDDDHEDDQLDDAQSEHSPTLARGAAGWWGRACAPGGVPGRSGLFGWVDLRGSRCW